MGMIRLFIGKQKELRRKFINMKINQYRFGMPTLYVM